MIPVALLIIGIVLIITGINGRGFLVGEILKDDFTGKPSYVSWIVAVVMIGFFVSFESTKKLGTAFYGLLLVVLFLSNDGFFQKFSDQIGQGSTSLKGSASPGSAGTQITTRF